MVSQQESCTSHPSRIECSSTLDAIATDEFDEEKKLSHVNLQATGYLPVLISFYFSRGAVRWCCLRADFGRNLNFTN